MYFLRACDDANQNAATANLEWLRQPVYDSPWRDLVARRRYGRRNEIASVGCLPALGGSSQLVIGHADAHRSFADGNYVICRISVGKAASTRARHKSYVATTEDALGFP